MSWVSRNVLWVLLECVLGQFECQYECQYLIISQLSSCVCVCVRVGLFAAVFDQPEVSNMQSNDAAKVLDEATIYAFVGPEENEFIKVYKSTGAPIVTDEDSAEYDVTVLKVKYSKEEEPSATTSSANREDTGNSDAKKENSSSSSSSSSASWLHPTLIAGASAICLASSAAAILLWRQRRSGDYYSDDNDPTSKANNNDSPRSFGEVTVPSTPSPTGFIMDRFKNKKRFDYAEFDEDVGMVDAENPSTSNADGGISPMTTLIDNTHVHEQQPTNNIKFPECQNNSFDDSSVSDVSAHVLGARGSHHHRTMRGGGGGGGGGVNLYASQAESLLLDTSMESYNMESMSALEHVRFENVLDVDGYSLTSSTNRYSTVGGGGGGGGGGVGGVIAKVASEDTYGEDGSLSTGAVPSELYSNLSMDDSLVYSHDNNSTSGGGGGSSSVAYAGHLFTLDMLRDKDKSLLVMPPPPSDVASDSSSQRDEDLEVEDYDALLPVAGEMNEHEGTVSQSITDELTKVMKLLQSPHCDDPSDEEEGGVVVGENESVDESVMHIGTVAGHHTGGAEEEDENETTTPNYDGLNVLMTNGPIVDNDDNEDAMNEDDFDDGQTNRNQYYLAQMMEVASDCMNIIDNAQQQNNSSDAPPASDSTDDKTEEDAVGIATAAAAAVVVVDDESSLVTQTLD